MVKVRGRFWPKRRKRQRYKMFPEVMRIYSKSPQERRGFVTPETNEISSCWFDLSPPVCCFREHPDMKLHNQLIYTPHLKFNIAPDKLPSQKESGLPSSVVQWLWGYEFFFRVVRPYRVSIYNPCAPQTLSTVFPYSSCSSPPLFFKIPMFQTGVDCLRTSFDTGSWS